MKREDRSWEGCERERKKTIEYGTLLVGVCEQGFGTEWELGELKYNFFRNWAMFVNCCSRSQRDTRIL